MRRDTNLIWFRRDLRLADNPAFSQGLATGQSVVGLFVWDPVLVRAAGPNRLAFLISCLRELNRGLGGRLVIRSGDPIAVVAQVAQQSGAAHVWCAEDFGPYGSRRDRAVAEVLAARRVRLRRVGSPYAVAPGTLSTSTGRPFQVFTPFLKAWRHEGWDDPVDRPPFDASALQTLQSEGLPDPPETTARLPPPGEAGAQRTLQQFLDQVIDGYDGARDRPDLEGTSRLSPYLKFGCLHPRQALAGLDPAQRDHQRFASELCWREFYADVLYRRPESARSALRNPWLGAAVDTDAEADARFKAWTAGQTGYPIVDAGMRQLLGEGWMHNRVRMIVASFLVKDLHVDWRWGARWFMRHLVDGDLASNQHNWQWVAGTGTDAAPYFRIFNPTIQGKRFDPDGGYIRRWVPELAGLANAEIHEPWEADDGSGRGTHRYPAPIVVHSAERQLTLARYAALKPSSPA